LRRAGSYLHNIFHNDNFRTLWLNEIRRAKGLPEREAIDTKAYKEQQYAKLAEYAREYLDVDYIMKLINKEVF
jgi:adenosylcobyric acid synthase